MKVLIVACAHDTHKSYNSFFDLPQNIDSTLPRRNVYIILFSSLLTHMTYVVYTFLHRLVGGGLFATGVLLVGYYLFEQFKQYLS